MSNLSRNENFYFAALVFYRNRHEDEAFNRMSDSLSDLLMIAGKNKQTKKINKNCFVLWKRANSDSYEYERESYKRVVGEEEEEEK